MGYQFSNQTKTLTHWQSGSDSAPSVNVNRDKYIAGFYSGGNPYFFPLECWDAMSTPGYKYRGTQYYGYSLDLSEMSPLKSMRQLTEDGMTTYYRAIYQLYEAEPINWKTTSLLREDPIKITEKYIVEAGETTGIAIPYFTCYALVQGHISTSQTDKMPAYVNDYPMSENRHQDYDTAPALAPNLFKSLGKKPAKTRLLEMNELTSRTTTAIFGMTEINGAYYSGGYASSVPLTVGASSSGLSVITAAGSCVDYNAGRPIVRPHARFSIGTMAIHDYSEYVGDGVFSIYITREPVKYELTDGVLWRKSS